MTVIQEYIVLHPDKINHCNSCFIIWILSLSLSSKLFSFISQHFADTFKIEQNYNECDDCNECKCNTHQLFWPKKSILEIYRKLNLFLLHLMNTKIMIAFKGEIKTRNKLEQWFDFYMNLIVSDEILGQSESWTPNSWALKLLIWSRLVFTY